MKVKPYASTVRELKRYLEKYPDDTKIIIDRSKRDIVIGTYVAYTEENKTITLE